MMEGNRERVDLKNGNKFVSQFVCRRLTDECEI